MRMLIRFSVENWMSFRDRSTLSLLATRERQHGERVPVATAYGARILPIGVIYGGNASGKTNLFKALNFVREFVLRGTSPEGLIGVDYYRLDPELSGQPCKFVLEMLADEIVYEFSFSATKEKVLAERLIQKAKTTNKVLYSRSPGEPISFGESVDREDEALKYASQGTRDNQLFLHNSVSQKIDRFKAVYDWFKQLTLVAPDTRFGNLVNALDEQDPPYSAMNRILPLLDTGIAHLGGESIPFESLDMADSDKARLNEGVKEGTTVGLAKVGPGSSFELYEVTRKSGELVAKKLHTYHLRSDGSTAKFEFRQESDGSQRVIHLLPVFLEAAVAGSKRVFVIDEINRSLHTLLTRRLIEAYLSNCSTISRSQILATTHDVLLMDQDVLRRDEMFVTERDPSGASRLYSLSEFKDVRYDKDIRKSYLQGRLGGVPRLLLYSLPSMDQGREEGKGVNEDVR